MFCKLRKSAVRYSVTRTLILFELKCKPGVYQLYFSDQTGLNYSENL